MCMLFGKLIKVNYFVVRYQHLLGWFCANGELEVP